MNARRQLFLGTYLACALFAACNGAGRTGPSASSPSPAQAPAQTSPAPSGVSLAFADPVGDCAKRSASFQFVDVLTHRTIPWLSYTPGPRIAFYVSPPPSPGPSSTDIAYEVMSSPSPGYAGGPYVLPSAIPPAVVLTYVATVGVPVIDTWITYGAHDLATVTIIPSGTLSADYETDMLYNYGLGQRGQAASNAIYDATGPTGVSGTAGAAPSPDPSASWDAWYQRNEQPAVAAVARGVKPDDGFLSLAPQELATDHPRAIECFWLPYRPYDIYVKIVHMVPVTQSTAQSTLTSQLNTYHASQDIVSAVGFAPQSTSVVVQTGVWPQLWDPAWIYDQANIESYVSQQLVGTAGAAASVPQWGELYTQPIPNPQDTSGR